jgi:type VII secretion-associated serine protease mycosin
MTLLAGSAGLLAQKVMAGLVSLAVGIITGYPVQDEIRSQQWHLEFLNIEQAHTISTGEGVVVGLIDTGVDGGHPDLAGSLRRGADFTFLERPDAWEDLNGHGTAMAGLIVAHGRALGIAPDATILPVRHLTDSVGVSSATAAAAIDWAVDRGATVLCLAFGVSEPDLMLERAIARAIEHDVVVVAGVGNTPEEGLRYPAAYPGVVGVAGVDRDGEHASTSTVSSAATLAAPSEEVVTTRARNVVASGYAPSGGTSAATAIVAGVAALIRSAYPELSAADVIHRMTATAEDRGAPGRDDEYGYGIVNPVAALTADIPPIEATDSPAEPTSSRSEAAQPGRGSTGALLAVAGMGVVVLLLVGLVLARTRRG